MKKSYHLNSDKDGYKCLVCNIALFRLKEVLHHILTLHCNKNDYHCTLCNTQFQNVGSLKKHIKNLHFGLKPFNCPACKKAIQHKTHLKAHIEKQHPGKKGLFKKALGNHARRARMEALKRAEMPEKERREAEEVTCQLCYKVYLSVETKERHLVTFHKQKPSEKYAHLFPPPTPVVS